MTFNSISRVLSKHNIKYAGFLLRNISSFLQLVKVDTMTWDCRYWEHIA
jgi:hypothetical protein